MNVSLPSSPILSPDSSALDCFPSLTEKLLFCGFGTGANVEPDFSTITAAIECMTKRFPDAIATTVVSPNGTLDDSTTLTYRELNEQASYVAGILESNGVKNGDAVCLFMSRSVVMIVAIVAILKVGACYVPQHVGVAPASQLQRVADATDTSVVLTLARYEETLPEFGPDVSTIAVDKVLESVSSSTHMFNGPSRSIQPNDRCYVIFTSGTTGVPKGVQVTHGNVANVILAHPMDLGLGPGLKIAQTLSISFDMGAWEILGALTHGATLLIRDRDISAAAKHANVIISTPTILATMNPSEMTNLKTVAVAGEPCPRALASKWSEFCTFYNSCGPTEVTIVNTAKKFDESESNMTIGKPTPNNTVYVLDPETMNPCKIGEVGEMWGGGACVSAGYLNNKQLTAERYVLDPFVKQNVGQWKMYRTGDLGRWNADGELEHFGRADDQVKVKGFRVELDGIARAMELAPGVNKAVVLKVGESLIGWATPIGFDPVDVKNAVGKKLPYYCIPSVILQLSEFPKTGNGKVDKRALCSSMNRAESETALGKGRVTKAGLPSLLGFRVARVILVGIVLLTRHVLRKNVA